MVTEEKELKRFIEDPIYRNRTLYKLRLEMDKNYNAGCNKLIKEKDALIRQRDNEIQAIKNARWVKTGEIYINKTEGKVRINGKDYLFSSIRGAEINVLYGAKTITTNNEKTKSKKHVSAGGALIGGAVAGVPGAVIGGVGLGKTTSKTQGKMTSTQIPMCTHLGVNVDIDGFITEIVISPYSVEQNSISYGTIINKAESTINKLREISKIPVPDNIPRAEDDYKVKLLDELIEEKNKELSVAQANKPVYSIPQKYRTEEQSGMNDEEYLAYLSERDKVSGKAADSMQECLKATFSGSYNLFLWAASILGILIFVVSVCLGEWIKALVLIPIVIFTNPYVRINYFEKEGKKFPYWIPPVVLFIGFIIWVSIPSRTVDSLENNFAENVDVEEGNYDKTTVDAVDSVSTKDEGDDNSEKLQEEDIEENVLSEEEYKAQCQNVVYEDLYNGRTLTMNTESYISYTGMVKDVLIYDDMDIVSYTLYEDKYDFDKKYWQTGLEHSDLKGYVGIDVDVYFLNDSEALKENDVHAGDIVKVYGEIINTEGSEYTVLCKYVEKEE